MVESRRGFVAAAKLDIGVEENDDGTRETPSSMQDRAAEAIHGEGDVQLTTRSSPLPVGTMLVDIPEEQAPAAAVVRQ